MTIWGNPFSTHVTRPDYAQTDETLADFIRNKPDEAIQKAQSTAQAAAQAAGNAQTAADAAWAAAGAAQAAADNAQSTADGKVAQITAEIVLRAADWSGQRQTVAVDGVTTMSTVFISPALSGLEAFSDSEIVCVSQGNGTLTFRCEAEPQGDIPVNVVLLSGTCLPAPGADPVPGENGGYYIPVVTQTEPGVVVFSYIPSDGAMESVPPREIILPQGPAGNPPVKGKDYWTDADKAEIVEEVQSSVEGIPDYWQNALDDGVESINGALCEAGWNKSAFLFYSDAHWNSGSQMSPALLKYLYKNTGMTQTFFGGDIVNNEAADYDTMKYLWDWRKQLKDLPNHHSVVGNHDDGNTTNNLFSEQYVYGYLFAAEETPDIVRDDDGLYYYIDNPGEKTRYLFLDTGYKDHSSLSEKQANFITNALKTTPDGWHIVVIAHVWYMLDYDQYDARPVPLTGLSATAASVLRILDNYNSRNGEFADCGAWVEFCVGGHIHYDYDAVSSTGIPIILVETDSRHTRGNHTYTAGTTDEASVNGIIADYDAKKIHVVRIGRGESREIEVKSTIVTYTNQLPISLALDGSGVFNGIGYKRDTRTSSSGDTAATGWCVSGLIPAKKGDIVRFKNMEYYDISGDGGSTSRTTFFAYDAAFTKLTNASHNPSSPPGESFYPVYGDNGDVIQLTVPSWGDVAYIRICCGDLNENSIITINEPVE